MRYKGKDVFGSTEAFNAAWQKKYGDEADYTEASAAAAGEILQLAIEAAGLDRSEKVRDALAAIDTETFYGSQVRRDRPDQFARAAGIPAAGRQAGRDLSDASSRAS